MTDIARPSKNTTEIISGKFKIIEDTLERAFGNVAPMHWNYRETSIGVSHHRMAAARCRSMKKP